MAEYKFKHQLVKAEVKLTSSSDLRDVIINDNKKIRGYFAAATYNVDNSKPIMRCNSFKVNNTNGTFTVDIRNNKIYCYYVYPSPNVSFTGTIEYLAPLKIECDGENVDEVYIKNTSTNTLNKVFASCHRYIINAMNIKNGIFRIDHYWQRNYPSIYPNITGGGMIMNKVIMIIPLIV